jgi:hypothetical protein
MKEIRKQKRKRRRENKNRKGPRGANPAQNRSQPQPVKQTETVSLIFPLISLTCGPHTSGHINVFLLQP